LCEGIDCSESSLPCWPAWCDYRDGQCYQHHVCEGEGRDECSYRCDETDGSCIYRVRSGYCMWPNDYGPHSYYVDGHCEDGECVPDWAD
jgi:hypothetical protein